MARALDGGVVQREVVHWNLKKGGEIDRKKGHDILGALARGDTRALRLLPNRPGRGTLGSFEFGLGRDDNDRYCIVEGSGKAVNWSEQGTTKGVTPVAHSHPIENRKLKTTYSLDALMSPGGGSDVRSVQQVVLPSIDDVKVANALKRTQPTHHVYTPYRLRKVKGSWYVRPEINKREPLTFRISNVESFIKKGGVDRYLSADLTAMAGRKDVATEETWSAIFGKTNLAVSFAEPNVDLEPW